jgi:predicted nucleic acid-binding protein
MATKKKLRLYLDTSVLNFVFADDALDKMEATKEFFKEIQKGLFDVFISDVVIREISDAGEPKRSKLLNMVKEYDLKILPLDVVCEDLADKYVEHKIIPLKYRDDAVHIAVAVINKHDVIVSWNLKHMVKLKTIRDVNAINNKLNYKEIDIRTPEEVIENEN